MMKAGTIIGIFTLLLAVYGLYHGPFSSLQAHREFYYSVGAIALYGIFLAFASDHVFRAAGIIMEPLFKPFAIGVLIYLGTKNYFLAAAAVIVVGEIFTRLEKPRDGIIP